jgi:hypothetical protein
MVALLCLASGACVSAGTVEPDARSFTLPLLDTGRWGTVMMNVEGTSEPQRLVFDSAAGGHVLDRAAADRLGLLQSATAAGGTVVGSGGVAEGGQRVVARNASLSDLHLGDTEFLVYDLSAFSRHGWRIDGIIGNALFARFSALFDLPNGRVILTEGPRAGLSDSFACQDNAAGAERPDEIGSGSGTSQSVTATAIVDTGSTGTTLNWPAAHAVGIREGDPRLRPHGTPSTGLDGQERSTSYRYTLPFLKVGNRILRDFEVTISPLPVFQAVRLQDRPGIIMGMSVLRTQAMAVDRGANRVCFGPAAA